MFVTVSHVGQPIFPSWRPAILTVCKNSLFDLGHYLNICQSSRLLARVRTKDNFKWLKMVLSLFLFI
jgi:di/tripeptidase